VAILAPSSNDVFGHLLMNGDDSAETQIRETRRFWAELTCPESWEGPEPGTEDGGSIRRRSKVFS
jgi:hypothetical protein